MAEDPEGAGPVLQPERPAGVVQQQSVAEGPARGHVLHFFKLIQAKSESGSKNVILSHFILSILHIISSCKSVRLHVRLHSPDHLQFPQHLDGLGSVDEARQQPPYADGYEGH